MEPKVGENQQEQTLRNEGNEGVGGKRNQACEPSDEPRRSTRPRKEKHLSSDFVSPDSVIFLVEATRDQTQNIIPMVLNLEDDDPKTYSEAMVSRDSTFWKEAINDEMDSIMSNNTWVLVDLPLGSKAIGCKWVFRRKHRTDGSIQAFKARLANANSTLMDVILTTGA